MFSIHVSLGCLGHIFRHIPEAWTSNPQWNFYRMSSLCEDFFIASISTSFVWNLPSKGFFSLQKINWCILSFFNNFGVSKDLEGGFRDENSFFVWNNSLKLLFWYTVVKGYKYFSNEVSTHLLYGILKGSTAFSKEFACSDPKYTSKHDP